MRQQINLYQPILAETRQPLSAGVVAGLLGVFVVGAAAYTIHVRLATNRLEAEVVSLRARQASHLARSEESASAGHDTTEDRQQRIKRLESALAARQAALGLLQSGGAGRTTGFAARLEALARRRTDELWLDRVVLFGTNDTLNLGGTALSAQAVPEYLRNLTREPALRGARFDDFVIERPKPDAGSGTGGEANRPSLVRFRAASRQLGGEVPAAEPAT